MNLIMDGLGSGYRRVFQNRKPWQCAIVVMEKGRLEMFCTHFREPIKRINQLLWKPHLTFIVNDGYLGESKGFANQKPASRYHPYIARLLLEHPILELRRRVFTPK